MSISSEERQGHKSILMISGVFTLTTTLGRFSLAMEIFLLLDLDIPSLESKGSCSFTEASTIPRNRFSMICICSM